MDAMKKYMETTYHLSQYQIAQITFLFKTLLSEISKILIMGILFHSRIKLYLFALFIMLFLRCSTGGLHFYTYMSCLLVSTLYLWVAIYYLPSIPVPLYLQILLLLTCAFACCFAGPVTSKYRPAACAKRYKQCQTIACSFLFSYIIALCLSPRNQYLSVGFWVIILHSAQLLVAKILGNCKTQ